MAISRLDESRSFVIDGHKKSAISESDTGGREGKKKSAVTRVVGAEGVSDGVNE